RDAELVKDVLTAERGHLLDRLALDRVRDHRRRGLADRTPAAVEPHVLDDAVVDLELDRQLVTAQRVHALGGRRGVLEVPVVAGVAVVVEDVFAVEVVHRLYRKCIGGRSGTVPGCRPGQTPNVRLTFSIPSPRRSRSSVV